VIFSYHLAFDAPVRWGPRQNIAIPFDMEKLEWCGNPMVKKVWGYIQRCPQNTGVWQTDRQTDGRTDVLPRHTRRAVKS